MSKRAFDKIKAGLDSAKAYLDGTADRQKYRVRVPENIDVRKIRNRLGLSQEAFAQTYGFALSAYAIGSKGAAGLSVAMRSGRRVGRPKSQDRAQGC